MSNLHHIQKEVLDFTFSQKLTVQQWQREASMKYQERLAAVCCRVMDALDDGRNHQIEKLELNLGRINEAGMEDMLSQALEDALRKKLRTEIQAQTELEVTPSSKRSRAREDSGDDNSLVKTFRHFLATGYLPWDAPVDSIDQLETLLHNNFSKNALIQLVKRAGAFRHKWMKQRLYLQFSGPFSEKIIQGYFSKEIDQLLFLSQALGNLLANARWKTPNIKKTQPMATSEIIRWIAMDAAPETELWPHDFVMRQFKNRLEEILFAEVEIPLNLLKNLRLDTKTGKGFKERLKPFFRELESSLFRYETTKKIHPIPEKGKNSILAKTTSKRPVREDKKGNARLRNPLKEAGKEAISPPKDEMGTTKHATPQNEIQPLDPNSQVVESKNEKDDQITGPDKAMKSAKSVEPHHREESPSEHRPALSSQAEEAPRSLGNTFETDKEEIENTSSMLEDALDHGERLDLLERGALLDAFENGEKTELSYYVRYSGIIITWPFLSRLFSTLKFTVNNRFTSRTHRERGVHLLGYMATGQPVNEEPDLILPKLLCGWPLQMPVHKEIGLLESEIDAANTMLRGLIENWPILKNTSIPGLRETFFMRDGKLSSEAMDWRLIVEQKGTDVLLDHLPWTISMIKMPWLKKLLKVDWA